MTVSVSMSVRPSVCLSASIFPEPHVRYFVNFCMHITYVRGSVAALRYVMYFRFMDDDVIFAHNGPYAGVPM